MSARPHVHGPDCDHDHDHDHDVHGHSPPQEPVRKVARPGRNDPCWCGSGLKYKKCHLKHDEG